MNNGFWWTEESKQDLLALSRDDFMARYPKVSGEAYRQQYAKQKKLVELAAPVVLEEDGLFHPNQFVYEPRAGVVPEGVERHVILGDTHGPFLDQEAWASVLDFVRYFRPHQINLTGDISDFYEVSRYTRNPNRRIVLGQEIEFVREVILAELRRAAPKAKIIWLEGNHEFRLRSYLYTKAPELASLPGMDMRALFRLQDLKIAYTENEVEVGDIILTHGHMARKHSGWTAKAMLDEMGVSVIHNHTHRLGAIYKTDRGGDFVAFENGCLCQKENVEYITGLPNWQTGFSCGWVMPSGRFHIQQIAVVGGRFIFDGRMFGSKERVDDCHD